MNQADQKQLPKYLICLLLAGITFAAFAGLAHSSFLTLDDSTYVVANPHVQGGFSWGAVKWAFSTFTEGNWHPVTWLSHILDCQLYGLSPAGPHRTNLALHIINTVLLFLLLERLTARLWPSAFVALLFGIHPMHVESVAWIAERKDVLSTLFFMLTLLAYVHYVELSQGKDSALRKSELNPPHKTKQDNRQSAIGNRQLVYYSLALLFFAFGLMSKPMLVTLPFVLLLLDYWPLRRVASQQNSSLITHHPLLLEKIPFLLLSAVSSYITFLAQKSAGAVKPTIEYSLADRFGHVPVSYAWYILRIFWPTNLSVFYPHQANSGLQILSATAFLLAITLLALICIRTFPYLLFGWLWFLGMLVPVIGLVQVGDQAFADRYAYLPYIGLFIIVAWGVPDLLACLFLSSKPSAAPGTSSILHPPPSPLLWTAAAAVAIACFIQTVQEVGYWKNGVALFERAVAVDPKNSVAWALMGAEYSEQNSNSQAIECLNRSLALRGNSYLAWQWLGMALGQKGDYAGAAHAYRMALGTDINSVMTLNNLAWLLAAAPDASIRNGPEAVTFAERACQLTRYQEAMAIGTLADAYAEAGRFDDAVTAAQKAQDVALADGQNSLAAENAQLMELYKSHQAFHMAATEPRP